MALDDTINLKVFFSGEVRRFTVDKPVYTSFILMKEKLQLVFPALRQIAFKLTWKDTDGDEITISSDEDLSTAFKELSGSTKILYVTNSGSSTDEKFKFKETAGKAGENQGCPFSSGNGIDLNDMHALGAMARQFIGPYLETLNAQAQNAGAKNNNQEGLFMDIIRNAAEGFFAENPSMGKQQNQENTPNNQAKPSTSKAQNTFCTNSATSTQSSSSSNQRKCESTDPLKEQKMTEALAQLHQMGFNNNSGDLRHLLECFDGNVAAVVKALTDM